MEVLAGPTISPTNQAFIRVAYGVLLLFTLAQALPQAKRFFLSERWGGYGKSDRCVDVTQNPYLLPWILGMWFFSAACLTLGQFTVPAALVNLLLCRYYFIAMRWKSILRGLGAPGFMTYWLAACVFFLEYSAHHDPTGLVRAAALFAFKVDFAVIMLCAGTYKLLAGYPKNQGMELGIINPWWGYWGRLYRRLPPRHWVFRTLNHLAYGTEIVAGLLMLLPTTQFVGALLIFVSFAFIATHIRLGFLCEMVMVCAFLFVPAGHPADQLLAALVPAPRSATVPAPVWLNELLAAALFAYVMMLPFAKTGQYYNLLARKSLPRFIQTGLERYTNFFGIIIWRVFSVDHTNFFARIYLESRTTGVRVAYARPGLLNWFTALRFLHVGEFICLVSLFTTLKYYPSNLLLFIERVLRYCRTLSCPPDSVVVFEYVSIRKAADRFDEVSVATYVVDVIAGDLEETVREDGASVRAVSSVSPVHEGAHPGSYAPPVEAGP